MKVFDEQGRLPITGQKGVTGVPRHSFVNF